MSKIISNNIRTNSQLAVMHLFEFDMYDFDGDFSETLYFTDHDIFVDDGTNEYTPLAITFDTLSEDGSMTADSITISIDNISGALSNKAISSEWRNNKAKITRVIYSPPSENLFDDNYEYGYGDNFDGYPKINITNITKDTYVLFQGIIDTFNASEQALNGTITSLFTNWTKAYPSRTYDQTVFTTIIDAMSDSVYWGREKDID